MGLLLPFDDADPDTADYQRVIRHECGHAIVARFAREPIVFLRIGRSLKSETPGETQRERLAAWDTECLITRAGETAERIFGDGTSEPASWDDDLRHIRKVVRAFRAEIPGYTDGEEWLSSYVRGLDERVQAILHRPAVKEAFAALSGVLQEKRREKDQQKAANQPVEPTGLRGDEIAHRVDVFLTPPV